MKSKNLRNDYSLKVDPSEFKARPVREEDLNFIWSSWLKSYRNSNFALTIPNEVYFAFHQALINQIMLNPKNAVTVLCDPDKEDDIIGYIAYCVTRPVIFYIYIKQPFRKLGLGQFLFRGVRQHYLKEAQDKDLEVTCTHQLRRWPKLAKTFNLVYNPYITGDTHQEETIHNEDPENSV